MYSSRNSPAVMGGLLDIIGTVERNVFDERRMQGLLEGKKRDERMKERELCVVRVSLCLCGVRVVCVLGLEGRKVGVGQVGREKRDRPLSDRDRSIRENVNRQNEG